MADVQKNQQALNDKRTKLTQQRDETVRRHREEQRKLLEKQADELKKLDEQASKFAQEQVEINVANATAPERAYREDADKQSGKAQAGVKPEAENVQDPPKA